MLINYFLINATNIVFFIVIIIDNFKKSTDYGKT